MIRLPALPPESFTCPGCTFRYDQAPPEAVVTVARCLREIPVVIRSAARDLHVRPTATTWSPVEYLSHMRDVLVTSALRLHRVAYEDQPSLDPMYNDWRALRFRYIDDDADHLIGQLGRAGQGLNDEVTSLSMDAWARTGGRSPDESRPASWFVQHAAHEMTHHLEDIRAILAS